MTEQKTARRTGMRHPIQAFWAIWAKAASLSALWLACLLGPAQAAPPTADDFARNPAVSGVVMSPSGQRVAMLVNDGGAGRRALVVLDLPPTSKPRVVASYADADVMSAFWVNDKRLVYEAYDANLEPGSSEGLGGTYAVDHDGNNRHELIARTRVAGQQQGSRIATRILTWEWRAERPAPAGSGNGDGNEVLVSQGRWDTSGDWVGGRVALLDTVTGQLTSLLGGVPAGAHNWIFDPQGQVRVVQVNNKGREQIHLRTPGTDDWTVLTDLPAFDPQGMTPLHLEPGDQLIVSTRAGKDTEGIYVYDLKTRKLDPEPLAQTSRFDISQIQVDESQHRAIAVHVLAESYQSVWFTSRMGALQKSLDTNLPGRKNRILCDRCDRNTFYVVHSSSDQHPGEYLLFDAAQGRLMPLSVQRPWIDPATQGKRSFHWIKARDGMPLPLVVTHPAGSTAKDKLPAVMLVHGGPWSRGASTHWSPEAQFLASRGYRVLEPDFRGSTGYGDKHFKAGWKQWGLAMQDDLADAVQWAAGEGLIDPQKVCIYGGSYGGYAALMGPVRHPDTYRCAASLVGVTDIMLMFNSANSDASAEWKRYGMPKMVGDPSADRALLDANSPVRRAADIKVPVLLAQGLMDMRVPREHADDFATAAEKAGVKLQRLNYPNEGHGFQRASNKADFWDKLDTFLAASLKR